MTPAYRALRENAAWLDLSSRGKIAVRGPDRTRLVHALTTNDIRALRPGDGCYTFLLNAQGRVLADANVFCLPDQLLLDTEPETRTIVLSHIEEFTIADDALTIDPSDVLVTLCVEGPKAAHLLKSITPALPEARHEIIEWCSGWVAGVSTTGQPGFLIFVPAELCSSLMLEIETTGAVRGNAENARIVRVENGKLRYGEEITAVSWLSKYHSLMRSASGKAVTSVRK